MVAPKCAQSAIPEPDNWLKNILAVRAGYKYGGSNSEKLSSFHGGCGFSWHDTQLNYAFVPYGDLGNTHRISLSMKFGTTGKKPKIKKEKLRIEEEKKRKK